eukprot:CAMPEP_0113844434 /NCGR_PEP_ID=MMETSP0372-20130328/236_1 /TAXON_ID=340204 /ORGANISM="Lankesteria abbotti" /LENGTH=637 /DNA_ID=CAMNT_0000813439 /DNA_START=216 /DNA_END=2129 /DNA_ORIENTATION=- /assembly_acc=CAM_ASM_000359
MQRPKPTYASPDYAGDRRASRTPPALGRQSPPSTWSASSDSARPITKGATSSSSSSQYKVSPDTIRKKLEKVLADKETFIKSAKASFKQFDRDNSGTLDFDEVKLLIERLCINLQLPPVDDHTLITIFRKYDVQADNQLELEEFCQLYWQLLLRIRDKYYPSKKMRVRRAFFVGYVSLGRNRDIGQVFEFRKKLGAGSFGEVHLVAERVSGLVRVCKIVNKDKAAIPIEQIQAEIEVLKSLDHPNIIKVFEVYEDYNSMYIIMELCEGGELLDRIVAAQQRGKTLTECYVAVLMEQLTNALTYFHSKRVAHKDLKPENILFQDKTAGSPIKVIDFGLAEIFERHETHSANAAGTALYMAPEVFKRSFDLKCDVWSAGCIMYLLLTGQLPFVGCTIDEVRHKVSFAQPSYATHCAHVSASAVDLMKRMLAKDPKRRVSAKEALRHPWFSNAKSITTELSEGICENMKKYMKQSSLKNALVNLMAHQLNITGSQIRGINDIFRALDKDGNGTLSHEELTEGLTRAGIPKWDINRIIQALDVDDSGNISYTEFLAACYTWRESELNIVWTAFSKMDTDGDGRISIEEFMNVLSGDRSEDEVGSRRIAKFEELSELVAQIDKNGDGLIDWDEFVDYMRNMR